MRKAHRDNPKKKSDLGNHYSNLGKVYSNRRKPHKTRENKKTAPIHRGGF